MGEQRVGEMRALAAVKRLHQPGAVVERDAHDAFDLGQGFGAYAPLGLEHTTVHGRAARQREFKRVVALTYKWRGDALIRQEFAVARSAEHPRFFHIRHKIPVVVEIADDIEDNFRRRIHFGDCHDPAALLHVLDEDDQFTGAFGFSPVRPGTLHVERPREWGDEYDNESKSSDAVHGIFR